MTLTVSICYASVYSGLEIRGNLGLKSNILDLNPLGITPREGSSPFLGTFENPNEAKGKREKDFPSSSPLRGENIRKGEAPPPKE